MPELVDGVRSKNFSLYAIRIKALIGLMQSSEAFAGFANEYFKRARRACCFQASICVHNGLVVKFANRAIANNAAKLLNDQAICSKLEREFFGLSDVYLLTGSCFTRRSLWLSIFVSIPAMGLFIIRRDGFAQISNRRSTDSILFYIKFCSLYEIKRVSVENIRTPNNFKRDLIKELFINYLFINSKYIHIFDNF